MAALQQLERAYVETRDDPRFWADLRALLDDLRRSADAALPGRPSRRRRADRTRGPPRRTAPCPARLRVYLKREDLAHTGAHKINNALGQALLTRRLGKSRVIAETGAGQHGVATATACALLGLPCVVYMGAGGHRAPGPERPAHARPRRRGPTRHVGQRHAQGRDQRGDARLGHERRDDALRHRVGDGAAPVPDDRARLPARHRRRGGGPDPGHVEGRLPDLVLACVGGGSNAIGLLHRFIGETGRSGSRSPRQRVTASRPDATRRRSPAGRRASCTAPGRSCSRTATARSSRPTRSRPASTTRASGRRSRRSSPRAASRLTAATDAEAVAAVEAVARAEGILPALETAHAFAVLPRLLAGHRGIRRRRCPPRPVVLIGLSGRGDKDLAAIERHRRAR